MKVSLLAILLVVFPSVSLAQQRGTGSATTKGACSPAVTGSHNSFTLKCEGVSPKLADEITSLVNKLAQNESDAQMILDRLNGCVASVRILRENQQPWKLTASQKLIVQDALSGTQAHVELRMEDGQNPTLFGDDLIALLKGEGWQVNGATGLGLNPDLVGVYIVVAQPNTPGAGRLNWALNTAGVESHLQVDVLRKFAKMDGVIYVIVGQKPMIKQ